MITKKQSKMLQAVAIILMLYHHFFCFPDPDVYKFLNVEVAKNAAWFAKICVGLFSFISGYGMCICMKKSRGERGLSIGNQYKDIAKRLLKLFLKYWFVIALYMLICILAYKETLTFDIFLKNAFMIDFSLNGSWWFMRQYFIFMLMAPLFDAFFRNISKNGIGRWIALLVAGIAAGFFVIAKIKIPELDSFWDFIQPTFIMVFASGFFFSYYSVYELIEKKTPSYKGFRFVIGLAALILSIAVRVITTTDPSYAKLDFIIVPVFSLGIIFTVGQIGFMAGFLEYIGGFVTFMWLTHVLVYIRTIDIVLSKVQSSMAFYLIELIMSFMVSWILTKLTGAIGKLVKGKGQK